MVASLSYLSSEMCTHFQGIGVENVFYKLEKEHSCHPVVFRKTCLNWGSPLSSSCLCPKNKIQVMFNCSSAALRQLNPIHKKSP